MPDTTLFETKILATYALLNLFVKAELNLQLRHTHIIYKFVQLVTTALKESPKKSHAQKVHGTTARCIIPKWLRKMHRKLIRRLSDTDHLLDV